jgi:hypothetical protein
MIIRFPTGFFGSVLPSEPESRGNVTYTISSSVPPRTNLVFPKAARGIIDRKRTINQNNFKRRQTKGQLAFSISKSTQSNNGNNSRTFELGQVLEFNNVETRTIQPMLAGPVSEIRHDTNQFDYELLELTQEDVDTINQSSYKAQRSISDQLNIVRQVRKNAEVEIINQQKIINDTTRNIDSINTMIADGDYPELIPILDKLKNRRDQAFSARNQARDTANSLALQADALTDQLRAISATVK